MPPSGGHKSTITCQPESGGSARFVLFGRALGAHIDGTAAGAKRAAAFHDGHAMAVARQPLGKGATRNARPGDQNFEPFHGNSDGGRIR